MTVSTDDRAGSGASPDAPARSGLVLISLILVAAVANLNLSVANVALPDIGESFDSSQTTLNLIAVGYSLGLAASVLWLGALGDRYGRKLMIVLGMCLSVPASLVAGFAPSDTVLFVARVVGGISAGMAYPTTLALITALWSGPARTKSIALWSALGGGIAALGPLVSGALLEFFDWGSVFLVTLPLVAVALLMAIRFVPAHVNESTDPVDNLGGILSALLVGALVISINFLPVPNEQTLALGLLAVALAAALAFVLRERRARNPLYDLHVAARPTFWVAACAGIIVFGSLMGAAFINQQYLQNVLGYSTIEAGAAILPAVLFMVLVAPRSAKLVGSLGSRHTLLAGQLLIFLSFVGMLLLWQEDIPYWKVALPLCFLGAGVGLAGTPSSNSLTGSVPVKRVGMASGTADLQRDLGGALDDLDLRRSPHRRLRVRDGGRHRPVREEHHGEHPEPAPAVLRERREPRGAEPEVREPDHGRGAAVVPRRRPVGLPGGDGRRRDRRRPRRLLLPQEGRGGEAPRRLSRRGLRRGVEALRGRPRFSSSWRMYTFVGWGACASRSTARPRGEYPSARPSNWRTGRPSPRTKPATSRRSSRPRSSPRTSPIAAAPRSTGWRDFQRSRRTS